jgi:hypothetical protein
MKFKNNEILLKNNEILLLIDILVKLINEDIHQKEQQDLVKNSILNAISENKTSGHSHCQDIGSDEEQPKSEKRKRGRPRKYANLF